MLGLGRGEREGREGGREDALVPSRCCIISGAWAQTYGKNEWFTGQVSEPHVGDKYSEGQ